MEDLNDRRSQMLAAFCMGFVFICIGIPFWWKTTEVYRADLPYSEIQSLAHDTKIRMQLSFKIVSVSEDVAKVAKESFSEVFEPTELPFIDVAFSITSEVLDGNKMEVFTGEVLGGETALETDIVVIFNYVDTLKEPKVFITQKKIISASLPLKISKLEVGNVARNVAKLMKESVINMKSISDVVSKAYGERLDFPKATEFHMRKTVRPEKGYDLLFSLLCPEPDKLHASWDIKAATSRYLKPVLEKLGNYAAFNIGSQVLYYSELSINPKQSKKNARNASYYLTQEQLPHVVNPIESRLGAQMSPNPTLNFVIYIPKEKYNPLRIQLEDGTFSETNTFLVPRWGAIMLKNTDLPNNGADYPRKIELESSEFMQIFVAQLRSLLGLEQVAKNADLLVEVEEPDATAITDLELNYLIRARVAENIATSVHTLHSLAQLLEKIQNIVINDKIAEHIYTAVTEIKRAKGALEKSELRKALDHSNSAFKASETAFFDQTLLELLYFPEDQKFAIYIPLFLPISLPLLGSLLNAFKQWKARRQGSEEGKQKTE